MGRCNLIGAFPDIRLSQDDAEGDSCSSMCVEALGNGQPCYDSHLGGPDRELASIACLPAVKETIPVVEVSGGSSLGRPGQDERLAVARWAAELASVMENLRWMR